MTESETVQLLDPAAFSALLDERLEKATRERVEREEMESAKRDRESSEEDEHRQKVPQLHCVAATERRIARELASQREKGSTVGDHKSAREKNKAELAALWRDHVDKWDDTNKLTSAWGVLESLQRAGLSLPFSLSLYLFVFLSPFSLSLSLLPLS